jgi:hypothetical protein
MRPDSSLLVTLARVRERLLHPTAANLEACSADLEWSITELRCLTGSPFAARVAPQIKALVHQIQTLHSRAGELRLGAARLETAPSSGYTAAGLPDSGLNVTHVAISG